LITLAAQLAITNMARPFFTQARAPLGIRPVVEVDAWVGFGKSGKPEF